MIFLKKLYENFINTLAKRIAIEYYTLEKREKWASSRMTEIRKKRAIALICDEPLPTVAELFTKHVQSTKGLT